MIATIALSIHFPSSFYINPYLTNGFSHHYQLGESTFIFRGVRSDFYVLSHFTIKFLCANRITPDGTPLGRRILRRHIWGYAVCLCPTKRTSGLNELKCWYTREAVQYNKHALILKAKCVKLLCFPITQCLQKFALKKKMLPDMLLKVPVHFLVILYVTKTFRLEVLCELLPKHGHRNSRLHVHVLFSTKIKGNTSGELYINFGHN